MGGGEGGGDAASFPATRAEALRRLARVDPRAYAASRNRLDGAVTRLSPYLTHGLVSLPEAVAVIAQRHPLSTRDKLVAEFGWREFFQQVAAHAGDAILADMRPTLPWPGHYASAVPADVREARCGVGAVDAAVRTLYATGYLHNHARLWLASYLVHVRKVHWRAGADWLWAHLLDGDLASNHLSWQWVAGSFSAKPYLFNAENVARFAPAGDATWDCAGTVVDADYESLEALARSGGDAGPEPGTPAREAVMEPALYATPAGTDPSPLDPARWAGRTLELVHPWACALSAEPGAWRLGVVHLPAHAAWPWSAARWRFVMDALSAHCDALWVGDLGALPGLDAAARVVGHECLFPGYGPALEAAGARLAPLPRLFEGPRTAARSFSQFWNHAASKGMRLPARPGG